MERFNSTILTTHNINESELEKLHLKKAIFKLKHRLHNNKTMKDDAKKLLEDGKIEGYLELNENKPKLTFVSNGINQTILKYGLL